jgi:hypothetical protein
VTQAKDLQAYDPFQGFLDYRIDFSETAEARLGFGLREQPGDRRRPRDAEAVATGADGRTISHDDQPSSRAWVYFAASSSVQGVVVSASIALYSDT